MFLELVATLVAGVAGAGLMMLLNMGTGRRLPRWLTPVAAGAAMIAATISNEYGWYDRTREALPEGLVVAQTVENQSFFRPWTYLAPYTERFVAVDMTGRQSHAAQPDQYIADVYFFGRWSPVNKMPVLVDCPMARRAPLADDVKFGADGAVSGISWVKVNSDDPLLSTICLSS